MEASRILVSAMEVFLLLSADEQLFISLFALFSEAFYFNIPFCDRQSF